MDEAIYAIYANNPTDPDEAKVFRAAERAYKQWCDEHGLKAVDVAKMTIDPNTRTYRLHDPKNGELPGGKIDHLRAALGL